MPETLTSVGLNGCPGGVTVCANPVVIATVGAGYVGATADGSVGDNVPVVATDGGGVLVPPPPGPPATGRIEDGFGPPAFPVAPDPPDPLDPEPEATVAPVVVIPDVEGRPIFPVAIR